MYKEYYRRTDEFGPEEAEVWKATEKECDLSCILKEVGGCLESD